jgi:hypothetical protein
LLGTGNLGDIVSDRDPRHAFGIDDLTFSEKWLTGAISCRFIIIYKLFLIEKLN